MENSSVGDMMVNYGALTERLSALINRAMQTRYLLYSLMVRSEASGLMGFAKFFRGESGKMERQIDFLVRSLTDGDHAVNFMGIEGISVRGSKMVDLFSIFEECLERNLDKARETDEFVASRIEFKIACGDIVRDFERCVYDSMNVVRGMRKKLGNVLNDYGALLMMDKQIGEECHD